MKVELKDINGIELQNGQHIIIYDKLDNKVAVEGVIKYVPGAFIIYPKDGSHKLLLYWYIRDDEVENTRERYDIDVIK